MISFTCAHTSVETDVCRVAALNHRVEISLPVIDNPLIVIYFFQESQFPRGGAEHQHFSVHMRIFLPGFDGFLPFRSCILNVTNPHFTDIQHEIVCQVRLVHLLRQDASFGFVPGRMPPQNIKHVTCCMQCLFGLTRSTTSNSSPVLRLSNSAGVWLS